MNGYDVGEVMNTFRVVADTREQRTPRAAERFAALGENLERATLDYGDYCGNIELPAGPIYDINSRIQARCVVERKMHLDELAACFTRGRERFEREFKRAADNKAKVFLLVEDGSYEAIIRHRYRSKFSPAAFMASLIAWQLRYDLSVIFCKSDTSGMLIKEILSRDMRMRLERGDYDG